MSLLTLSKPLLTLAVQVPELNVQNGVLKALSFLFEYIGEMGKDYIYAITPLLEDALMDRDLVQPLSLRQLACSLSRLLASTCDCSNCCTGTCCPAELVCL